MNRQSICHLKSFLLVALAFFTAVSGCKDDEDNYIDGSLVKNYNISYDGVRALLYSSSLSVEYMSDTVDGVAALRVTLNADGLILAAGKTYDLLEYGSVTRFSDLGSLPELQSGELTLTEFSEEDGSPVAGNFHAVFVTDDGVTLNLRGAFAVDLEVVPI